VRAYLDVDYVAALDAGPARVDRLLVIDGWHRVHKGLSTVAGVASL
jgi:hypothetical protein